MRKNLKFLLIILLIIPRSANATAGYLKKNSIKECNGVLYGYHGKDKHYHQAVKLEDGNYNSIGDAIYSDPCEDVTNDVINNVSKNNDTRLAGVVVNGDSVEIKQTMEYKTTLEDVNIKIEAMDENAKVEFDDLKKLKLGNNIVNIKVISSDLTEEKYSLIIVREEPLSDNVEIEIKVDDKVLEFNDYKTELEVNNDTEKLNIEYKINDEKSKVEIIGNEKFVVGKNDVKIIVTSESGVKKEYVITVIKLDKLTSIYKYIIGGGVVATILVFLKKIFKK